MQRLAAELNITERDHAGLLARFLAGPTGRKLAQEKRVDLVEARAKAAEQIAAEATPEDLAPQIEAKDGEIARLTDALKVAHRDRAAMMKRHQRARDKYLSDRRRSLAILEQTAPAEVIEFERFAAYCAAVALSYSRYRQPDAPPNDADRGGWGFGRKPSPADSLVVQSVNGTLPRHEWAALRLRAKQATDEVRALMRLADPPLGELAVIRDRLAAPDAVVEAWAETQTHNRGELSQAKGVTIG